VNASHPHNQSLSQISFDIWVLIQWGPKALFYLFGGAILGMGLHPSAGHFIAEHFEFVPGAETYSYYGPMNLLVVNGGFHNEHHDFPRIPWTKLPELRRIAGEFYDPLPYHTSYIAVLWRFITDPDMGPHRRVRRRVKTLTPPEIPVRARVE